MALSEQMTSAERKDMSQDAPLTMTIPEAGQKYLGLSRGGAYNPAHRGEIQTIKVGRLLRVPVRAMEALLDRQAVRSWPNDPAPFVTGFHLITDMTPAPGQKMHRRTGAN